MITEPMPPGLLKTFGVNLDNKWVSASDTTLTNCLQWVHRFSDAHYSNLQTIYKITSSDLTGWHYATSLSGPQNSRAKTNFAS